MAYATTAELGGWTSIDDHFDDAWMQIVLDAVTLTIDKFTHRSFGLDGEASARVYVAEDCYTVRVDDIGDLTDFELKTDQDYDGTYETVWGSTEFITRPGNAIALGGSIVQIAANPYAGNTRLFPCYGTLPLVQVTAKWGFPATPADVKMACLLQSSRLLARRRAPLGMIGSPDAGIIGRLLSKLDPDVELMLQDYNRNRSGVYW